jgi:hypothetical protein
MATFEEFQAEVQKRAGAMPPSEPTPPDTSTPGGFYRQNIGGPANDYLRNFMSKALPGHPLNNLIADMLAPETLTQAAVTAGTLAAPEAKAAQSFGSAARNASKISPILQRLMYPMGAGAVGGFAEQGDIGDAAKGTAIGLLSGVPAEAASGVSRWYAGSKLAQRFFKEDPEAMKAVITRLVPEIGNTVDPENVGKAFWQGTAQNSISNLYDKRMTAIADVAQSRAPISMRGAAALQPDAPVMLPGGVINSPRISELKRMGVLSKQQMDVEDTMQAIRDLRMKGRTAGGDPKLTLEGRQARDYASEVSADLKQVLDGIDPKLGSAYEKTDSKYAKGAEMIRYLKQPGIVDENGAIDMRLLQNQLKTERAYGLSHAFTPDEFKDLTDTVFRGGDTTVVDKILKSNDPHLRAHVSEGGRIGIIGNLLSMFRNNQYAGNYDVDFLKPKIPQLLTQGIGVGALKGLDQPIGSSANTLKAPSED